MKFKHFRVAAITVLLAIAGVGAVAAEVTPDSDRPYLQGKSEKKPLPEDTSKIKDKEWLTIAYPEFPGGFKPRLAVVFSNPEERQENLPPIENETLRFLMSMSNNNEQQPDNSPFQHVEDIVRQALGATGRFTMLERTTAKTDVLDEQQMGQSGMVDPKSAPKTGALKGADFVVKATVLEVNPEMESKEIKGLGGGLSGGILGVGSVDVKGKVAFCRVNVRLVNTTTGEIVHDMTVIGTSSSSGVGLGGGLLGKASSGLGAVAGGFDQKKAASMGDAIQVCANKIAFHLTQVLEQVPWKGVVAKVSPLIINAGKNIGLKAGLELQLVSKGEAIMDPDDPTVLLEYVMTPNGTIRIVTTGDKTSTCEIVEGGAGVKVGDYVILEPGRR